MTHYIVIDAPGCYGDWATIYSSHTTLKAALKAAGGDARLMVASDGGFPHQKGRRIHRDFAGRYVRLLGPA